MKRCRKFRVPFFIVIALNTSCNHVIDVQFYIENPYPAALNTRYYSRITYDSVDYELPAGARWHIDGRRVPLPRKVDARPSFERDKRFIFGRIWNDQLRLLKNINHEEFWKLENPAPDRFVYTLVLDSTVMGP
jgi:hypothetical protein